MPYKKITSFNVDEQNKKIELYLDNSSQATIPNLDNLQFEIFSTVLNHQVSANKNFDENNSQLNVSRNLISSYVKGYNLNFIPKSNGNQFGIVLTDKNSVANSIVIDNHLVFLSVSEVLSNMP